MGIFDKFKKPAAKPAQAAPAKKAEKAKEQPKQEATMAELYGSQEAAKTAKGKTAAKDHKVKKTDSGEAYRILIKPVVSEKATYLGELNQYAFEVNPSANKITIKKAIESLYSIKPIKVNIINNLGKAITYGKHSGRTKRTKKAIVTLKKGDTIKIYEGI